MHRAKSKGDYEREAGQPQEFCLSASKVQRRENHNPAVKTGLRHSTSGGLSEKFNPVRFAADCVIRPALNLALTWTLAHC